MKMRILNLTMLLMTASLAAYAEEDTSPNHPCQRIKEACEKAGFVKGKAKEGYGLWVDCIDPIMRGESQPKKATKPLPQVDASLVLACKAKHPNFGQGKGKQRK